MGKVCSACNDERREERELILAFGAPAGFFVVAAIRHGLDVFITSAAPPKGNGTAQ